METNMELAQDQYNHISNYYEIFYSGCDFIQFEKDFIKQHKDFLEKLPKDAKLCDCSCGNGLQAIALKKEGYDIIATDISDEMINLTLKNAKNNNLEFPIKRMSWKELSKDYVDLFDVVFCWGNSISHSSSRQDMIENLRAIYKTIKNHGKLIIETRNWDKIIKNKQRYYTYEIKEYNGKKYLPFYIMNVTNFDKQANLEMLFLEIKEDLKTECIGFKLDFMPFEYKEFQLRLKEVGFKILKDTYKDNEDFYYLVLEK